MLPVLCVPDHPIFRDRDVLESDYVPAEFNFRDSQLKEIAYCLQPGLAGLCPLNAILRGIPGTGKTTSVKRILSEVEEATRRALPVYVNCQVERTLFSILAQVHFRMYGHSPPALGSPEGAPAAVQDCIREGHCYGVTEWNPGRFHSRERTGKFSQGSSAEGGMSGILHEVVILISSLV